MRPTPMRRINYWTTSGDGVATGIATEPDRRTTDILANRRAKFATDASLSGWPRTTSWLVVASDLQGLRVRWSGRHSFHTRGQEVSPRRQRPKVHELRAFVLFARISRQKLTEISLCWESVHTLNVTRICETPVAKTLCSPSCKSNVAAIRWYLLILTFHCSLLREIKTKSEVRETAVILRCICRVYDILISWSWSLTFWVYNFLWYFVDTVLSVTRFNNNNNNSNNNNTTFI